MKSWFKECRGRSTKLAVAAISLVMLGSVRVFAAPLLSVDFGTTTSPVETGFQGFGISTGNTAGPLTTTYTGLDAAQSSGSVTLTLTANNTLTATNNLNARDRTTNSTLVDQGSFTNAELYRDIINSSTSVLSLGLSGLNSNTTYAVKFYVYDDAAGTKTITFTDLTSGAAGASGSVSFTGGYAFTSTTSNDQFATLLTVTSDVAGKLVFRAGSSSGSPSIGGVVIQAVPEPASLGLSAFGVVLLGRRRTNRRVTSLSK